MEYNMKEEKGGIRLEGISDFEPSHIFECGQCFRWARKEDGSYTIAAGNRVIRVACRKGPAGRRGCTLTLKNTDIEEFYGKWQDYFDLQRDYGAIKETLAENDDVMRKAISFGEGIRILNQDEWETLISFILSQNRSIPLIQRSVEALCRRFGPRIGTFDGKTYYGFPEPEALARAKPEDLGNCCLGYRTGYVLKTAAKVAADPQSLYKIKEASWAEAFQALNDFPGVGPKVANCIMLFSMGKYESFPVDVWVRRLMNILYGIGEEGEKEIGSFVRRQFGDLGGFAQQYLFYYARTRGLGKRQQTEKNKTAEAKQERIRRKKNVDRSDR